jgi:hypothetical protein
MKNVYFCPVISIRSTINIEKVMKNMKFGFFGALAIAGAMFFTGCTDPCKDVTCVNGECVEGDCVCDAGYEGVDCGTALNAKFAGTYANTETCNPSGPAGPYSITVSPKSGSQTDVTFVGLWEVAANIVTAKVATDGVTFSITRQALSSSFDIEVTTGTISADGKTINVTYKVYATGASVTSDVCTATLVK